MPTPDRSFPQQLVDAVRNELREFSADDPGIGELLDRDANRILRVLAEQPGVTLPEAPKPPWRSLGMIVYDERPFRSTRVTVEDDDGDDPLGVYARMAEDIAGHLNGDCTRPYLQLADAVRAYLNDDSKPLLSLSRALEACEEAGDGD